MKARSITLAAALALCGFAVQATDVGVSVSINQPGVYGRIDVGSAPPPAVIYAQPVIIQRPAVVVQQSRPVYLKVPPGHERNWAKHCHRYDACGVPVYFVKYDDHHHDWDDHHDHHHHPDHDDDHDRRHRHHD